MNERAKSNLGQEQIHGVGEGDPPPQDFSDTLISFFLSFLG